MEKKDGIETTIYRRRRRCSSSGGCYSTWFLSWLYVQLYCADMQILEKDLEGFSSEFSSACWSLWLKMWNQEQRRLESTSWKKLNMSSFSQVILRKATKDNSCQIWLKISGFMTFCWSEVFKKILEKLHILENKNL